jgi:hypothetical protein
VKWTPHLPYRRMRIYLYISILTTTRLFETNLLNNSHPIYQQNMFLWTEARGGGGGGCSMHHQRPPNTPLHVCGLLLIDRNFYAYQGFSCVQQADTDSGPNLHLSGGQWNKYKRFSNGICDGCFSKTWFRVPYRLYLQRRVLCCLSKIWLL